MNLKLIKLESSSKAKIRTFGGMALIALTIITSIPSGYDGLKRAIQYYFDEHKIKGEPTPGDIWGVLLFLLLIVGLLLSLIWHLFFLPVEQLPLTDIQRKEYREAYLKRLQAYARERYNNAVHLASFISQDVVERIEPEFVQRDQDGREITIRSLDDLVTASGFRVLLLAPPGGGKTTCLLKIMLDAIQTAIDNEEAPVPVFAKLSEWQGLKSAKGKNSKTERIRDWLRSTLSWSDKGRQPAELPPRFLDHYKVSYFLDGFDEAAEELRGKLLTEINDFLASDLAASAIICCRLADYEALQMTMDVAHIVTVQSYSDQQIHNYLDTPGNEDLNNFLKQDSDLKQMARSPLDLRVMLLASRHSSFKELVGRTQLSHAERRIALFDIYVLALTRRADHRKNPHAVHPESTLVRTDPTATLISAEKVYEGLGFVAKALAKRMQSSFAYTDIYHFAAGLKDDDGTTQPEARAQESYIQAVFGSILLGCAAAILGPRIGWLSILLPVIFAVYAYWAIIIHRSPDFIFSIHRLLATIPFAITTICFYDQLPAVGKFADQLILWLKGICIILPVSFYFLYRYYFKAKEQTGQKWVTVFAAYGIFLTVCGIIISLLLEGKSGLFAVGILIIIEFILIIFAMEEKQSLRKFILHSILIVAYCLLLSIAGYHFYSTNGLAAWVYILAVLIAFQILSEKNNSLMITGLVSTVVALWLFDPAHFEKSIAYGAWCWLLGVLLSFLLNRPYGLICNILVITKLQMEGRLPWRFRRFLRRAHTQLLIGKAEGNYDFHRRMRDYFAIRDLIPKISKSTGADKLQFVYELLAFRDASCDILMELITDSSKQVRLISIEGLGRIGNATAGRGLIQIIYTTTGELQELACENLQLIKDPATGPFLLPLLEHFPADHPAFTSAVSSLWNLELIHLWNNESQISAYLSKAYLDTPISRFLSFLLLLNRKGGMPPAEFITQSCELIRSELFHDSKQAYVQRQLRAALNEFPSVELFRFGSQSAAAEGFLVLYQQSPESALRLLCDSERFYDDNVFLTALREKGEAYGFIPGKLEKQIVSAVKDNIELIRLLHNIGHQFQIATSLVMLKDGYVAEKNYAAFHIRKAFRHSKDRDDFFTRKRKKRFLKKQLSMLLLMLETEREAAGNQILWMLYEFRYYLPSDVLCDLLINDQDFQHFKWITLELIRRKENVAADGMELLLASESPALNNLAINYFIRLDAGMILPKLQQMKNQVSPVFLPSLSPALVFLDDTLSTDQIGELYLMQTCFKELFVLALIRRKQTSALRFLSQLTLTHQIESDRSATLLLCAYWYEQKERAEAERLLNQLIDYFPYTYLSRYDKVGKFADLTDAFGTAADEFVEGMFLQGYAPVININDKACSGLFIFVLKNAGIDHDDWIGLAAVGQIDKAVAEALLTGWISSGEWLPQSYILDMINRSCQNEGWDDHLIPFKLCMLNPRMALPVLEALTTGQEAKVVSAALVLYEQVSRELPEDMPSVDGQRIYTAALNSENVEIWATAVRILSKQKIFNASIALDRVKYDHDAKKQLLSDEMIHITGRLEEDHIKSLFDGEQPEDIRLAAICYGNSGHGNAVAWLARQLDETKSIPDEDEESLAAVLIQALKKLGTPEAKGVIESYRRFNSEPGLN